MFTAILWLKIAQNCWNYDEENRPTFAELYTMMCELDIS